SWWRGTRPWADGPEWRHQGGGGEEGGAAILGRKTAAPARQPDRQKALLGRLAELQNRLGRSDVAREAFRRALDLDGAYRPALRWLAAGAKERGDAGEAAARHRRLAAPPAGATAPATG